MNRLSFRRFDDSVESYELLVDGKPIGTLVGPPHYAGIPGSLIKVGLPSLGDDRETALHVVAVCSCGEIGCGRTACRVLETDQHVLFSEFDIDGTPQAPLEFTFERREYDQVMRDMTRRAQDSQ